MYIQVTPEVMRHATKMKIIGRAGVGVDNINVSEATRRGIMVMNTPGGNTVSTAQLAMSLVCNLARKVPGANMSVKAGKWERKKYEGGMNVYNSQCANIIVCTLDVVEMSGKTLGIVGCGRIGQVVAGTANTMGMRVLGFDPVMPADVAQGLGIQKVELDQVGCWRCINVITYRAPPLVDLARSRFHHAPHSPHSRHS
jgi:phosphoglycerate dehydrogenase-like enzyme